MATDELFDKPLEAAGIKSHLASGIMAANVLQCWVYFTHETSWNYFYILLPGCSRCFCFQWPDLCQQFWPQHPPCRNANTGAVQGQSQLHQSGEGWGNAIQICRWEGGNPHIFFVGMVPGCSKVAIGWWRWLRWSRRLNHDWMSGKNKLELMLL